MHPGRSNFHAVWPSLLATSMGLMAFLPVLSLYLRERFAITDPAELAFQTGVIYGAAPFAAAIAGPFWGALGDRAGKKPMAIRANVAIALTTALMPLAPTPAWLLAMRALQGVLAGYVAPAMALVMQDTPRERHGAVIAKLQVAMATGSFLGPMVAPELTHWFGRSALFWFASGFAAFAAFQLWWFAREAPPVAAPGRQPLLRDFLVSSWRLVRMPAIGWLLALVLVMRLGQNMLEPLLAPFLAELGPASWFAWSATQELALDRTVAVPFATLAIAQWVCTPWWGRRADRHGPLRCLAVVALGLMVVQAAASFVATTEQFLVLRTAQACLMAGAMTLAYAAASKRVPDGNRTLAFAMVQSCIQYGLALGPLLGAFVAGRRGGADGYRDAMLVAAGLCGLAGVGMLVLRAAIAAPGPAARVDGVDDAPR